jgi:hypothetical protein
MAEIGVEEGLLGATLAARKWQKWGGGRGGAAGSCRKLTKNGGNVERGGVVASYQKMAEMRGGERLP